MILDDIFAALKTVDEKTFYGACDRTKITENTPWNYTVFGRDTIEISPTSKTEIYRVVVVRENYIPDGTDEKIIAAMRAIPGVKLRQNTPARYSYTRKNSTNIICEMLEIEFAHAMKRCVASG